MTLFFSAEGGPIWIKFRRLVQNGMSTAVIWSKSKQDVEFQYGVRLGEFNGMSSQSHLLHCRVLLLGELDVIIPQLRVILQGAATGRIQWDVISEPRIITLQGDATWWIHCHVSRATVTVCSAPSDCLLLGAVYKFAYLLTYMPHCRVRSPGEINVLIVPHCRV